MSSTLFRAAATATLSSAHCCGAPRGQKLQQVLQQVRQQVHLQQQRFRSSLKPGDRAVATRSISEADLRMFGALSGDENPVHSVGVPSGSPDEAPRILVHGAFLNALAAGVMGSQLPGPGCIVVGQNLRFPRPCLVGDVVTTVVEVKEVRKVVEVSFKCIVDAASEDRKVVLEGNAKLIMADISGMSGGDDGGGVKE